MGWIRKNVFLIILLSVVNLLLTPLVSSLLSVHGDLMAVINFTIVALVSMISTDEKILRNIAFIAVVMTLISVWSEFFRGYQFFVVEMRLFSTMLLFCTLAFILIRNILNSRAVNIEVICGAMAGYIVIGLVGGTLFEFMEYSEANSIRFVEEQYGYDYYYYSFISLITIGYGDITPSSPQAKSLSILLGIIGQFYMAIGVALFVGRHLYDSSLSQQD